MISFEGLISRTEATLEQFRAKLLSSPVPDLALQGQAALRANNAVVAYAHFKSAAMDASFESGLMWAALITDGQVKQDILQFGVHVNSAACKALVAANFYTHGALADDMQMVSQAKRLLVDAMQKGSLIALFNAALIIADLNFRARSVILQYVIQKAPSLNVYDCALVKSYLVYTMHYYELTSLGHGEESRTALATTENGCPGLYRFFAKVYHLAGCTAYARDLLYKSWLYDRNVKSLLDYTGDDASALRLLKLPVADLVADALDTYPVGFVNYTHRHYVITLAGDIPMQYLSDKHITRVVAQRIPHPFHDYAWCSNTVTSVVIEEEAKFFNDSLLNLVSLTRVTLVGMLFNYQHLQLALALLACGVKRVELSECTTCILADGRNTVDILRDLCKTFFFVRNVSTKECVTYLRQLKFRTAADMASCGRSDVQRRVKSAFIGSAH